MCVTDDRGLFIPLDDKAEFENPADRRVTIDYDPESVPHEATQGDDDNADICDRADEDDDDIYKST